MTVEDAPALAAPTSCPDAAAFSPELFRPGRITVGQLNTFGEVLGVWPAYQDVHSYNVAEAT